jgi:hypothetical protein
MTHIVKNRYTRLVAGKGAIDYKAGDKISPSPAELAAFGDNFRKIEGVVAVENPEPPNSEPPTPAQVRVMNKGALEALAAKMEVSISGAKNNDERAALIIAALEAPNSTKESEGDDDDKLDANKPPNDETNTGDENSQPQTPGAEENTQT